jgi:hypothetical protein
MKTLILLLLFGMSIPAVAQNGDTLFISKLTDIDWIKTYENKTKFKTVKFADGSVLQVGEKMRLGNPSGSNHSNQQTIGIIGSTTQSVNNFSYLMLGRIGGAMLSGITYLPETFKGREVEIEEIKFMKSGKKNPTAAAMIIFKNPGMDITVLNLDSALQYGELINPKAAMTSDQALAELQKAKTKLDLGVISQEQYDIIKAELMKIIK